MGSFWDLFKRGRQGVAEAPNDAALQIPRVQQPESSPKTGITEQQGPRSLRNTAGRAERAQRSAAQYGIDHAIRLMRTLPMDERADLVVSVIKITLESLNVRVSDIVADGTVRLESLRGRITEFQLAVSKYEREIEMRRQEIARLEAELDETTRVQDHLQLAGENALTPRLRPALAPASAPPTGPSASKPDAASTSSRRAPQMPSRPRLDGPKSPSGVTTPAVPHASVSSPTRSANEPSEPPSLEEIESDWLEIDEKT
jgi:hypothetical protein